MQDCTTASHAGGNVNAVTTGVSKCWATSANSKSAKFHPPSEVLPTGDEYAVQMRTRYGGPGAISIHVAPSSGGKTVALNGTTNAAESAAAVNTSLYHDALRRCGLAIAKESEAKFAGSTSQFVRVF